MNGKKLLMAAAGVGGEGPNVESLFSTYVYDGNESTQTITNNIDLSGEGGMVWIKARDNGFDHRVFDTVRGGNKSLVTNGTFAENSGTGQLNAFNSDGFDLQSGAGVNGSYPYCSWTFRKAPKFFDIVQFEGDNVDGRTVSHNLGSTPGMVIIKNIDRTGDEWITFHRGLSSNHTLKLDQTSSQSNTGFITSVTSTGFNVSNGTATNASGYTYIAYIFAHNDGDGGFGSTGDQDIIKCGSYNGTGSAGNEINLGFEPQWILFKRTDASSDWVLFDIMRGLTNDGQNEDRYIYPNEADAEGGLEQIAVTPTGFITEGSWGEVNNSSGTYIYMAIRRGPMAIPTSRSQVFEVDEVNTSATPNYVSGFPVDFLIEKSTGGSNTRFYDRQRGMNQLYADNNTFSEGTGRGSEEWDHMNGVKFVNSNFYYCWMWRRAPSYFDTVCYTGSGSAQNVTHNLGAVPEMMIIRRRNIAASWTVYHKSLGNDKALTLNDDKSHLLSVGHFNNTTPTESVFSVGDNHSVTNNNGNTYVCWLFASLSGISHIGGYTGTGNDLTIDCGFSSGARLVLIKRWDRIGGSYGSVGDWYFYDSERGIVSGNDPYLFLNTTTQEVTNTDYIDPHNSGFTVTSTASTALNASGGSYIYYAIAA